MSRHDRKELEKVLRAASIPARDGRIEDIVNLTASQLRHEINLGSESRLWHNWALLGVALDWHEQKEDAAHRAEGLTLANDANEIARVANRRRTCVLVIAALVILFSIIIVGMQFWEVSTRNPETADLFPAICLR